MKPTKQQQQICDFIIEQVSGWKYSNDILSPTHHSDLDSSVYAMVDDDEITQAQADYLDDTLFKLLTLVRII